VNNLRLHNQTLLLTDLQWRHLSEFTQKPQSSTNAFLGICLLHTKVCWRFHDVSQLWNGELCNLCTTSGGKWGETTFIKATVKPKFIQTHEDYSSGEQNKVLLVLYVLHTETTGKIYKHLGPKM